MTRGMTIMTSPIQAGARVMVQDVHALPLPDEYGYNVLPNTQTILALQEVSQIALYFSSKSMSSQIHRFIPLPDQHYPLPGPLHLRVRQRLERRQLLRLPPLGRLLLHALAVPALLPAVEFPGDV